MSYQLQVRIDDETKQPFESICSKLGLSMSNAVNIFAKAVIRKNGIPFDLVVSDSDSEPPYADKLRAALAEVERGETVSFTDTHAMFAEILAENDDEEDE